MSVARRARIADVHVCVRAKALNCSLEHAIMIERLQNAQQPHWRDVRQAPTEYFPRLRWSRTVLGEANRL